MQGHSLGLQHQCLMTSNGKYDRMQQNPSSASPLGCRCLSSISWQSPTRIIRSRVRVFTESPITLTFLLPFSASTYGVKVDEVTKVLGTTEQRAVVSCKLFPGSMEVVGHHIDEVQFPGRKFHHGNNHVETSAQLYFLSRVTTLTWQFLQFRIHHR